MNNKDRKVFWNTLCSLEGSDTAKDAQLLHNTIKYPPKIYRFRAVTINSLEGLRTNNMYFSTADYYDDPFDSYIHIDWNLVEKQIHNGYYDSSAIQNMAVWFQDKFNISTEPIVNYIHSISYGQWVEYTKTILVIVRKEIQKRHLSICFAEQWNNEVLWIKYASEHKGFALEYEINDDFLMFNENGIQHKYYLYPIYYSNQKYNASEYALKIAYELIALYSNPIIQNYIYNNIPKLNWHYERIGLIKHKCHEHDKEWRLLYPFIIPSYEIIQRPKIERKPTSVILGLRIGVSEKNLIISLAKEAGISKIYQLNIKENGKLGRILI